MSDFLRTLAAVNDTTPKDRLFSFSERVRRHVRASPAYCAHSWKHSSPGFKVCTAFSSILLLVLLLLQVRREPQAASVGKSIAWHASPSSAADRRPPSRRLTPCTAEHPCTIQLVADLDTRSKIGPEEKPLFMSKLHGGSFVLESQNLTWFQHQPFDVIGKLSEEGRGMELSELVMFGDTLLSFDDRSGIMYELIGTTTGEGHLRGTVASLPSLRSIFLEAAEGAVDSLTDLKIVPIARAVLPEGDGELSAKGMKIEWATEKDGLLYVGSFGKEFTSPDGKNISGYSNLWVVTVSNPEEGSGIERMDWTPVYDALRKATGTSFPGYMIHEAVNWSPAHRKWFFLPRRISEEAYNENADEHRGAEKMLIASEDFTLIEDVQIRFPEHHRSRGFSSFKFVPGTEDRTIIALRSSEDTGMMTQATYMSVFDITGKMIFPEEILISSEYKYEGVEIW